MSMSKDRVQFRFSDNDKNRDANVDAAIKAFGITRQQAMSLYFKKGHVICRPSQFARFLIYRSSEVNCNRFAELEARLFNPQVEDQIDVSKNPNIGDC